MLKRAMVVVFAVMLNPLFTDAAFAQTGIDLMGVGLKFGLVNPDGIDAMIGYGALADLGRITPEIMLESNLDYWSEAAFRDLIVGGTAKYMFKSVNLKVRPFAGGGVALHFLKISADARTKAGVHFGGGLFYALSAQFDLLADGRYTIVSNASQIALQAGLVYKLTK